MNIAYFFDAGTIDVIEDYIGDSARYVPYRICAVVIAETRGKARSRFVNAVRNYDRLYGYTSKMKSYKLRDIDYPPTVDTGDTVKLSHVWAIAHERGLV